MKEWKKYKIEDIAAKRRNALAMGPFGSNIKTDNFVEVGVPIIRGVNISKARFNPTDFVFLTEEKADELKASNAFPGDLVFTHRGTLGQIGLIPDGPYRRYVVSQSQMKLSPDTNIVNPLFLFYYFDSIGRIEILKYVSGSGVPAISSPLNTLKNIRVSLPSLPIQQKIASILSTYDDLIENNNRRIAILEKMAENIYKEWFVRMRFPGYEKVKLIDGVPVDWKEVKISDLYKTSSGATPSRKKPEYYVNGIFNWIKTGELRENFIFETEEKITLEAINNSSAKLFPEGTVIIAMYGATIGRLGILAEQSTTNQACCALITKNELFQYNYIFLFLQFYVDHIINLGLGAAQQNISQELIKELNILKPNEAIMKKFNKITTPLFELRKRLQQECVLLKKSRDHLLPKLISGKLSVEHLVELEGRDIIELGMVAEDKPTYQKE